jgi:UDP-N-acetylmuramyl pentapeptide phosphotransferase/UDP-N-acetylglucosamine-1-phosphate transferase
MSTNDIIGAIFGLLGLALVAFIIITIADMVRVAVQAIWRGLTHRHVHHHVHHYRHDGQKRTEGGDGQAL